MNNMKRRKLNISKKKLKFLKKFASVTLLCLIATIILFPFWVLLTRSVMSDEEVLVGTNIFPTVFNFQPYIDALDPEMLKYFKNTMIVALVNCICVPLSASLCAFGFAKLKFVGKNFWFFFGLCTAMLPTIVTQIPLYVMYSKIGWLGTYLPLIIPGMFGGGVLNIFLMRQYMRGIPDSIVEAAKIDGASWFRTYWQFVLPLCRPVLLLVLVQTFMTVWNDFTSPLIYLNGNEELYTMSVGIYIKFLSDSGNEFLPNLRSAIGILMIIPEAILFFVFQRELVDGVSFSGEKS